MTLSISKLSSELVEGIAYKSNLSSFRGSVFGGSSFGEFNGFVSIANWVYEYTPARGELLVWKELDDSVKHTVFTEIYNITELSFTFDKQMLNVVSYVKSGISYMYFFDSSLNAYNTISFTDVFTPKVALNSINPSHIQDSNVVLGYVKGTSTLCVRLQQDRYSKEYIVKEFDNKIKLFNIGYADTNRFQYEILESVA